METKVPEYAPWAPNGYKRLINQINRAEVVLGGTKKKNGFSQTEIDDAAQELNMAINTMRPGNLAEPEDLNELIEILARVRYFANKTDELREAMREANMVVEYVNDGSGTLDLITKATQHLKEEICKYKRNKHKQQ